MECAVAVCGCGYCCCDGWDCLLCESVFAGAVDGDEFECVYDDDGGEFGFGGVFCRVVWVG